VKPHTITFIKKILNNRTFRVTRGDVTSDCINQEAGVPQGSVVSATLFGVKINRINKQIAHNVVDFLFVDDFTAGYASTNMNIIERRLQKQLTS